jgi:hypothetical protein
MVNRILEGGIKIFGALSFLGIVGCFLALNDIWHDFASPDVWKRAGQALPDWYSPVNRCPLEWGFLQVGFLLIVIFHILLFARLISGKQEAKTSE